MAISIEPGEFARAKVVWRNNAEVPQAPPSPLGSKKAGCHLERGAGYRCSR
ncbi:unnamed protein product, partial [marine sediment metagenome]